MEDFIICINKDECSSDGNKVRHRVPVLFARGVHFIPAASLDVRSQDALPSLAPVSITEELVHMYSEK